MAKYDCVLVQRSDEDGMYASEIMEILDIMELKDSDEVDFVRIEGDSSISMGFILMEAAARIDFQVGKDSGFENSVKRVMNDTRLETENHLYDFAGINTYMYY